MSLSQESLYLVPSPTSDSHLERQGKYSSQPHPNLFFFFMQNFFASSEVRNTSVPVQKRRKSFQVYNRDGLLSKMGKQISAFYKLLLGVCYIINVHRQLSTLVSQHMPWIISHQTLLYSILNNYIKITPWRDYSRSKLFEDTKLQGPSLVAQMVKNLPATQETWVLSLSQEDSPGGGQGNPLQYSCLKNLMDRRLVGYP